MQPPIPESGSETLAPPIAPGQDRARHRRGAPCGRRPSRARCTRAGANVVLHYRSSAEDAAALAAGAERRAARLAQARANATCSTAAAARRTGRRAPRQAFGGLDILVNNASTFYPTPLGDITEIDWDDLIGTNLKAPLFLAQAAAAALRERQRPHHQSRRHPRHAAPAPLPGVQRRQSRPHHADQVAGARARAAGARQRDRARTGDVARGRPRPGAAGRDHRRAPR